ncbi:MAG TPA: hypothetical protein VJA47_04915 [archaeon]|nr:hypothetical protein [archaeon]
MGFLNDLRALIGSDVDYIGGVQQGEHFYCIDSAGDVYRQLNPMDGPVPKFRPWVSVESNSIPTETREALRLLSGRYI